MVRVRVRVSWWFLEMVTFEREIVRVRVRVRISWWFLEVVTLVREASFCTSGRCRTARSTRYRSFEYSSCAESTPCVQRKVSRV